MSKGGDKQQTQVQKAEPWSGQQPFLWDAYTHAQWNFDNQSPQYYPHNTFAAFSGPTNQGLNMLTNRAGQGNPYTQPVGELANDLMGRGSAYTQQAGQSFGDTASGDYLNANPYLSTMIGNASRDAWKNFNQFVMPSINATFGGSGRSNSGLQALALGHAAGDVGNSIATMTGNLYGSNYQSERDRMLQAAGGLANVGAGDVQQRLAAGATAMGAGREPYTDIAQMLAAGGMYDTQAQREIDADKARWDYWQNLNDSRLNQYIAQINGIPSSGGTTSTSMSGDGGSALGNAIGGGLTGAGLSTLFWNTPFAGTPWGLGLAGLGAIGGLLS